MTKLNRARRHIQKLEHFIEVVAEDMEISPHIQRYLEVRAIIELGEQGVPAAA